MAALVAAGGHSSAPPLARADGEFAGDGARLVLGGCWRVVSAVYGGNTGDASVKETACLMAVNAAVMGGDMSMMFSPGGEGLIHLDHAPRGV